MSLRRTLIVILWVVGALLAWCGLARAVGLAVMYLVNERQVRVPVWAAPLLNIGAGVGALVVPVVFAILGMRRKLPGTRAPADSASLGFPMDT